MKYYCGLSRKNVNTHPSSKISQIIKAVKDCWRQVRSILNQKDPRPLGSVIEYIEQHKTDYPLFSKFVQNTERFYIENFNQLSSCIIREKRLLWFETPNRVKITHEYDVDNFSQQGKIVFLFLPQKRLSWLKIFVDGNRVTIAKSDEIKRCIYNKLSTELSHLELELNATNLWDEIWTTVQPIPCFIYDNKLSSRVLIEFEYYENLEIICKNYWYYLNLIDKRVIQYGYASVANSAWLYIHAPNKFEIRVFHKYNSSEVEENSHSSNMDPEIVSYTIKQNPQLEHIFNIVVDVPSSLKWWFNGLYFVSLSFGIYLLLRILVETSICVNINVPFLAKHIESLSTVGASIIALIIATRGWLVNEETVLKRYSKYLTFLLIILSILLLMYFYFAGK